MGLWPTAVAADPAAPTTFALLSVKAAHNVIETGDTVVAFEYNIYYATGQPTTPANKLFHFRLMDTDGQTQLGAADPYPYNNSGYGEGFSAFYFPAATAPTWETALIIKMVGNPQYWGTPPSISYTLVNSDYSQLSSQSENQSLLGNYIIQVCRDLEVNWSIKLLADSQEGTVLNDTGAAYGKGTIPGLMNMAPQIFSTQAQVIDTSRRGWTAPKISTWLHQWDGTVLGDWLNGLGTLFHTNWQVLTGLFLFIIVIALFAWGMLRYSDNQASMIAGAWVLTGGTAMGFLHPAILAVIVLLYALYSGYIFMGRHA